MKEIIAKEKLNDLACIQFDKLKKHVNQSIFYEEFIEDIEEAENIFSDIMNSSDFTRDIVTSSLNGKLIAQGNRFIYNEVEVVFGIADLNEVDSYRGGNKSRCSQSLQSDIKIFEVKINENLLGNNKFSVNPFYEISFNEYSYEREMQHAPACWMWDYLRRSGASGFFLPLSGGADSSSVAIMVSLLCRAVFEKIDKGKDQFILHELRKIVGNSEYYPKSAEEIASLIFVTAYLETNQSSAHTKSNSKKLAEEIQLVLN